MMKDLPLFEEPLLDFAHLEVDPRENPLYILHAYKNQGKYPPEYNAEAERFVEDSA